MKLVMGILRSGSEEPFRVRMIGILDNRLLQMLTDVAIASSDEGQLSNASLPFSVSNVHIANNHMMAGVDVEDLDDDGCLISVSELLDAVRNLILAHESNRRLLDHEEFYPLLLKILTGGGFEEKLSVCKLLWSLCQICPAMHADLSADSTLTRAILQCHCENDSDSDLSNMTKCIMLSVKSTTSQEDGECKI